MTVPQVDGLLEATYGRVDQLEDRYLGMVEAPSSNLGVSISLNINAISEMATLPQTSFAMLSPVCWLGVSTSHKKRTAGEYLPLQKDNSSILTNFKVSTFCT